MKNNEHMKCTFMHRNLEKKTIIQWLNCKQICTSNVFLSTYKHCKDFLPHKPDSIVFFDSWYIKFCSLWETGKLKTASYSHNILTFLSWLNLKCKYKNKMRKG